MDVRRAIGALLLGACGESGGTTPVEELLVPPPEGEGVQLTFTTTVEPGEEIERCRFVEVPDDGIWISRAELRYTGGGHHVILWRTHHAAAPVVPGATEDGTFDCSGGPFEWGAENIVTGAQSADARDLLEMPGGVALRLEPGTVLLFDVHLLNATPEPLDTEARINLWTVRADSVREEAGVLMHYDLFIHVPAGERSTARMSCPVPREITLATSFLHMHKRGVGGWADVVTPDGARDRIEEVVGWEDLPVTRHEPGLVIAAGSVLEHACDYENDGAVDVEQGQRVEDEMCALVGLYWPRDLAVEMCSAGPDGSDPFLGGEWVGAGGLTCGEVLDCMQEGPGGTQDNASRCVQQSCPEVSRPLSDAIRCLSTKDPFSCGAQLSACEAATCP